MWRAELMNNGVNIKEIYSNLDRNDFEQVSVLVSQIIKDIKETIELDYGMGMKLVEDYLFDLINPELLDMENN